MNTDRTDSALRRALPRTIAAASSWMAMAALAGVAAAQDPGTPSERKPLPVTRDTSAVETPPIDDDSTLVMYDASDLARQGIERLESTSDLTADEAERQAYVTRNAEMLAALVSEHCVPRFEKSPSSIIRAANGGVLVVNASPKQHEWIRRFLDEQRRSIDALFAIEFTLIDGADWSPQVDTDESGARILDEAELAQVLADLRNDVGADFVQAPRVLSTNLGSITIESLKPVPYISDWVLWEDVEPGGQSLIDPVVDTVQEGVVIEARAMSGGTDSSGANLVSVDFDLEHVELLRMETMASPNGQIGLPVTQSRKFNSSLTLTSGSTAVFWSTLEGEDTAQFVLLVNARRIDPVEGEIEKGNQATPAEDRRR